MKAKVKSYGDCFPNKTLDAKEVAEKTKHYLDKDDVKAVMARRDKIVEYFQKLISEKGENEVLY